MITGETYGSLAFSALNLVSEESELYVFALKNRMSPLRISIFWRRYKQCRSLLCGCSLGLSRNLPSPSQEANKAAAYEA